MNASGLKKVFVVFGTRPEAVKLFPLIRLLRETPGFQVIACATAQHRDLLDQMLTSDGLKPDIDLDLMTPGQTLSELTGRVINAVGRELQNSTPNVLVVQGDTTTAMASALAAFYSKIPVVHVEAGLRSGDIYSPWPEEVNRKIISQIAVRHYAPTDQAAKHLSREGVPSAQIVVTGNTVIDALMRVHTLVRSDPEIGSMVGELRSRFVDRRIILVTCHRRENFGEGTISIAKALLRLADRSDTAIVLPLHPNPNVRSTFISMLGSHRNIALMPALDYPRFIAVLDLAYLALTDSGGVQEEAPSLGKPVLVLRNTTERPEGVAAGTAKLVGTDTDTIVSEVGVLLDNSEAYNRMARAHNPYGDGRASQRIVKSLAMLLA